MEIAGKPPPNRVSIYQHIITHNKLYLKENNIEYL